MTTRRRKRPALGSSKDKSTWALPRSGKKNLRTGKRTATTWAATGLGGKYGSRVF